MLYSIVAFNCSAPLVSHSLSGLYSLVYVYIIIFLSHLFFISVPCQFAYSSDIRNHHLFSTRLVSVKYTCYTVSSSPKPWIDVFALPEKHGGD